MACASTFSTLSESSVSPKKGKKKEIEPYEQKKTEKKKGLDVCGGEGERENKEEEDKLEKERGVRGCS